MKLSHSSYRWDGRALMAVLPILILSQYSYPQEMTSNESGAGTLAECRAEWDTRFEDDFDEGLGKWAVIQADPAGSGWGISSNRSQTGSQSLHVNGAGAGNQYVANQTTVIVAGPFHMSDKSDAQFLFRQWIDTEENHDLLEFGASLDGINFNFAPAVSGQATSWQINGFSIGNPPGSTRFIGENQVWIGFRFSSDGAIQREGAYIDALCLLTRPDDWPLGSAQAPVLEIPSNGSVGVKRSGAVLGWTRVSGALSYDVQISTRNDFAAGSIVVFQEVPDQLIQGQRTFVVPGTLNISTTYYWRIRARNKGGPGAFSDPFSFTTEGSPNLTPNLLLPANGATNTSTTLDLSWQPVTGASSYDVEVRSTDTATPFLRSTTALTSIQLVAPIAEWTYAWRVRVSGDPQNPWSPERAFQTGMTGPLAPVLVSPADGATDSPLNVQFSWQAAPQAISYRFQLSKQVDFSPTIVDKELTGLTTTESGLDANTTYYWRVRGNASDGSSTFSRPDRFTTGMAAPQLSFPANGATNTSTTLDLSWLSVAGASSYDVEVRSADTATPFFSRTTALNSITLVAPIAEWTYAWRVRVSGDSQNPWSPEWTFQTGMTGPLAPALVSPADGVANLPRSIDFSWESAPDATSYRFQLSDNDSFSPALVDRITAQLSTSESDLTTGAAFFWRVSGIASDGSFTFSPPRTFTVSDLNAPADPPELIYPGDGQQAVDAAPMLRWGAVSAADDYLVEIASGLNFSSQTILRDSTTASNYQVPTDFLEASKPYWWRVSARNEAGPGPVSSASGFTTYVDAVTVSINRSFGSIENQQSYRLIGLPGDGRERISLTGEEGTDWRMFWDNGSAGDNYLVEYNSSSSFEFRAGRGFWLISSAPWVVNEFLEPVQLDESGSYSIPLHPGWNIISNPLDVGVSWDHVRDANGQIQDLWRWSGTYSNTSTFESASSGEAYYFNNATDLEALTIPYPGAGSGSSSTEERTDLPAAPMWLELRSDHETVSQVGIGYTAGSEEGLDPYDQLAPRAAFQDVVMYLRLKDVVPALAVEYKPDLDSGSTFDLVIESKHSGWFELSPSGSSDSRQDKSLVLVDARTGRSFNLEKQSEVLLEATTNRFRLFVGSDDFVAQQLAEVVPEAFDLLGNFPNPFKDQTTIEFAIPSDLDGEWMTVEIFDVQGRRLTTLEDGLAKPGLHRVTWNPRSVGMARGTHFVRLTVGQRTRTLALVMG